MVSLKTVALVAVTFIVVFLAVSAYFGSLPAIAEKAQGAATQAKTLFAPVINMWTNLPSTVKNVIMLGIPTLVTLFFAWTKNRAMTKLQQTEQQAAAQATQLSGELSEAQTSAVSALQENVKLKEELDAFKNKDTTITRLLAEKEEQVTTIKDLQIEVESWRQAAQRKSTENSQLSAINKQLQAKLEPKDSLLKQQ